MKYSGIGGQAVMEGVMMKNKDRYAVAVRKPDGEIVVDVKNSKQNPRLEFWRRVPIARGVVSFVESLVTGISTLMYSSSFFEEEEKEKPQTEEDEARNKRREKREAVWTVVCSVVLAVAIFMLLPYYLSMIFGRFVESHVVLALIEGVIRLVIFIAYIMAISLMKDIQRTFMYHGAEHKCINCIEHGMELNVENVRISSRQHKRCGTSFLLFVMIISIIFFAFIDAPNRFVRVALRLILIPVIAGVSYEFIRLAGRSDNRFVNVLSKPGLLLQKLTTREPDDSMIEVGIASVEAVFDWRSYLEEMKSEKE